MTCSKRETSHYLKIYAKVALLGVFLGAVILVLVVSGWDSLQDSARFIFHQSISSRLEKEIDTKFFQMYPEISEKLSGKQEIVMLAQGRTAPDNPEVLIILQTARQISGASIVYVMDRKGTVVGCSTFGREESLTGENYGFRPYFVQAMQGKHAAYPALGVTTEERGIYFSTPVFARAEQKPVGVVVIKTFLNPIDSLLNQITEPVALLSPDGIVFAANRPGWMYHAALPIDDKTLTGIRKSRQFSDQPLPTLETALDRNTVKIDGAEYTVRRIPIRIKGWQIGTLASLKINYSIPTQQLLVFWGGLAILIILSASTLVLLLNISKRRIVEKELRRAEEKYRGIFENAVEGIVQATLEGQFLSANPTSATMLGYSDPGALIAAVTDIPGQVLVAPDQWGELIQRLRKEKAVSEFETECRCKDGSVIIVSINARMVTEKNGGTYINGFLNNISNRRSLEAQLRHAQKMEAVGTLAGGLAHDLNNVLQGIYGYIGLLRKKKEIDNKYYSYLHKIDFVIGRSTRLIRQLLTTSRKLESRPEPLDLNACVVQACELLRRTIPRMIEIETRLSENPMGVNADPVQVEQVLLNLSTNARDAMPDGGCLTFEVRAVVLDEGSCRSCPELSPGRHVYLGVSDTGHGMDGKTAEHIFEPFFTTKEKGEGTGLGLATVYSIIKNHNGHISCESRKGRGTVFNIYLPALATRENIGVSRRQSALEPEGGKETILLADDEPAMLETQKEFLELLGYTVLTAKTGEEAAATYKKNEPGAIDLVILDLDMPGLGGRQCLKELLETAPSLKVIITSGCLEKKRIREVRDMGAAGFLGKPFPLVKLTGKVREVLDR